MNNAELDAAYEFESVCPHVLGNPYMPHFPTPKQAHALGAHLDHDYTKRAVFELLFGGAAGGGKSDWLLMVAAQFAWKFGHFRAVLLRRTHAEMMKAGALMSRAMKWWLPLDVHWDGSNKVFRFPSGATVEMGYHAHAKDDGKYHGAEYHMVGFDELTHWPDADAWEWLSSRIRKSVSDPIPLQLVGASNPGQAGHVWVKGRFVGGIDVSGQRIVPVSRFIRSTIDDNPYLDRASYKETLSHLHPTRRAQLLDGDWDARDPGDYFRQEWFGPLLPPEYHNEQPRVRIRHWDLAASEADTAARTAGVLMARLRRGARVIEHATAFRATPGKRDGKIIQQAHIDGRMVAVGLEIEPGSGGPAQFDALERVLKKAGFKVVGARPKAELSDREAKTLVRSQTMVRGKEGRADPVASCLERGCIRRGECDDTGDNYWAADEGEDVHGQHDGIRLVTGAWTQSYLDEIEGFPGATLCDLVDATTGAWAYLEAHPFGLRTAPAKEVKREVAEEQNMHPDERPERSILDGEKTRGGHWRP